MALPDAARWCDTVIDGRSIKRVCPGQPLRQRGVEQREQFVTGAAWGATETVAVIAIAGTLLGAALGAYVTVWTNRTAMKAQRSERAFRLRRDAYLSAMVSAVSLRRQYRMLVEMLVDFGVAPDHAAFERLEANTPALETEIQLVGSADVRGAGAAYAKALTELAFELGAALGVREGVEAVGGTGGEDALYEANEAVRQVLARAESACDQLESAMRADLDNFL